MSAFDELKQFDQEFKPEARNLPNLSALADGDYDFEIVSAVLERTEKTKEVILRVGLKVNGTLIENAYFFRNQQAVDILGSDLCTLGFDTLEWKPPARPFSHELGLAVPKLPGRKFRGKKVTKANDRDPAKPHHNLYVNSLLGSTPAPAGYSPPVAPAASSYGAGSSDIPF